MRIGKSSSVNIEKRVRNLSRLSTLPYIAAKVVELVENPKTSASTLGKIISMDQVLAARILKLANSAYYGFPRKISTINLAIVVLGFNTLRDLVVSLSVIDQFSAGNNHLIDPRQFWKHALEVGMGAKHFSQVIHYPIPGEVFVGGLLHDIGLLVLLQEFPDLLNEIFTMIEREDIDFDTALLEKAGCSRAQISSWLVEGWNLPPKLVNSIRYHLQPEKDPQQSQLTWVIHFADQISLLVNQFDNPFFPKVMDEKLLEEQINKFFKKHYPISYYQEKFQEAAEKANDFLDILTHQSQQSKGVSLVQDGTM
ncbi:MAG: HDOD domain-containing protein [Calditrichaeota bacterium]|nr:MAG: HDOD domain-containing protein [Calditrichota bacterium]